MEEVKAGKNLGERLFLICSERILGPCGKGQDVEEGGRRESEVPCWAHCCP